MIEAVETARSIPVEEVLAQRGYHLKRKAKDLVCPCPVCGGDDRFVITLKKQKQIWYCRGCDKGGDSISLVQHLDGIEFPAAVEVLAGSPIHFENAGERAIRNIVERQEPDAAADTAYALRWWNEAVSVWDTLAQSYLASRRCDGLFPPDRDAVFRFHPECVFGRGQRHPCLLSLLRNVTTDEPQAVHRTALTPDGKKIDRKMLGPKAGAAVKLWPQSVVADRLVIGEGIETTLSAALRIRHRDHALAPAWAAIDAGNLAAFPIIHGVQQLTILVDNDAPDTKGRQAGQDAAKACSQHWVSTGRVVRRLTPKRAGTDFNDILLKV